MNPGRHRTGVSATTPAGTAAYVPRRAPQLANVLLRELQHQLYLWPGTDPHPVVLLHGWGDSGATWQFLVDHTSDSRSWLALDLRGFGRTQHAQGGYWFPDYLADLDALLDHLSPGQPFDIVGHSMGGNIAMLYAGVRPQRVRRLVNLDGFGLAQARAEEAPGRYAQWLDQLKQDMRYASYENYEQFVSVLARRNPRTPPAHLAFIARAWAYESVSGRVELRADPAHRRVNPVLYQRDQALACWRLISAPSLWVTGDLSEHGRQLERGISSQAPASRPEVAVEILRGAGHMLHHEQPQTLAAMVEAFLSV